jgi:predicted amidohydrolase
MAEQDFAVALAQIDPKVGDVASNVDLHCAAVERARKEGARLVVFPELSLTGYTVKDLAWEIAIDPASPKPLEPLLRQSHDMTILVGCVEDGSDHGLYNSVFVMEEGQIRFVHRKVYLPTYGMFEEGRYFSPGRTLAAFSSRLGRLGILVCEDLWHIALPYAMVMDGAEILCCPSASPTRLGADAGSLEVSKVNQEHHSTYARLLSSYLLYVNRVGFEDGVNFWGGSSLVAPSGAVVARGAEFSEDLVIGTIQHGEIRRARRFSRHLLDENTDLLVRTLERIRRESGLPAR